MSALAIEGQCWTRRRWLVATVVVMLGQVGLIFWLSRHQPVAFHSTVHAPTVILAKGDILERLALSDPAQFTLANPHGFSGGAWLEASPLEYDSPAWSEPLRPLALSVPKLASALSELAKSEEVGALEPVIAPDPQLTPIAPLPELPAQSTFTVEGELAGRPLLSMLKLSSWAAPEILSNSVVQIGVNRAGTVFSAVLLDGPKDSKEGRAADANALGLARSARFQALRQDDINGAIPADAALQWGQLVFHWHTIPPPPTNSTVATP